MTTNRPFSIVIPHFHDQFFEEAFLVECLASVKKQCFTDFECIVVLDGFSTEAEQIFTEIAGSDERFVLIKQTHAGLPRTRMNGMKYAIGRWIISLDSDDYFVDENALQTLFETVTKIEQSGQEHIVGGVKNVEVFEYPQRHSIESWLVYLQYSISMCAIPRAWLICHNYNVNGVFDFDVRATLTPLIERQASIEMLPKPVVFYRQRIGSMNYIKETQMPELETKQAIGTYQKLLQLNSITFRQKVLCWLGIWRYHNTPPTHVCDRILRGFLTKLSKKLSASSWKAT